MATIFDSDEDRPKERIVSDYIQNLRDAEVKRLIKLVEKTFKLDLSSKKSPDRSRFKIAHDEDHFSKLELTLDKKLIASVAIERNPFTIDTFIPNKELSLADDTDENRMQEITD